MSALQVVTTLGPRKPQRSSSNSEPTSNYYTPPTNTNFLLETSFASLQSPSSNSSIMNGYFSTRSHPSPISFRQQTIHSSLSNTICSKSQSSASVMTPVPSSTPVIPLQKSFSLSLRSCVSPKIDLIHDDWLGLAPLASPESLSELSSISSRASLVTTTNVIVEINTTPKVSGITENIHINKYSLAKSGYSSYK